MRVVRRLSLVPVLLIGVSVAVQAQPPADGEAAVQEPVAEADRVSEPEAPEAPAEEAQAEEATDQAAPEQQAPAEEPPAEEPAEPAEPEQPAEPEGPPEPASDEDPTVVDVPPAPAEPTSPDGPDEPADAAPAEEPIDWAGLIERAPKFLALTHHAAVHMPIALWMFGALFVVIGVVAPSVRTQIPLACLIGGAVTSVAAAASGWWYADYEWGEPWAWADGFGDWSEHLVRHRWIGVALVVSSILLSILALVSRSKKSKSLGVLWRLGLIGLAAAVALEGHLGGEMIQGEGFLEDAYQEWVNPEAE